ncbi:PGPGW domain-containing protein [candidate division CSSED10-310 bacterium]|uniref:PGPGW domain-containing protein n=1 Tax=candidate division CSSED10-310 bacterium TaxID=2855610 RepID=A0ABV6Z1U4_UNCC1
MKIIRQTIIFILGVSIIGVGAAMIFLPGPAVVVIPTGLAVLATEFIWARRLLKKIKKKAMQMSSHASDPRDADDGVAQLQ